MEETIFMSNINSNKVVETKERKDPNKELVKELKQVGQITSTHGIPRIISRPFTLKIIWTAFFLTSIGVCLFILVGNFRDYFNFGVNTLVIVVPQDTIPMPVITVCNLNPLITHAAQKHIAKHYKDTYNVTFTSYKEFRSLIDSGRIPNDIDWLLYQSYSPDYNVTVRDSFGFTFDDQQIWCKQDFYYCEPKFRPTYHPRYGNCIVYNSGILSNGSRLSLVEVSSEEYGLDLAIFTGIPDIKEPYYYEPPNKGIVLIIDEQNAISLDQEGISLESGSYANIALTKTNSTNLPLPYNNCYNKDSMKSTNLTNEMRRLNMTYDRGNCFTLCFQKTIIETLGCFDMRYPRLFNASPCNTKDLFLRIEKVQINDEDCQMECPFDCNTIIYDVSISYASFPNYNSFKIINRTKYEFLSGYFPNGSFDYLDLQRSTVGFFIYYDPLTVTMITQTPSISFPELVSNAGGTLGVFIGISLLSFVELLEVAFIFCVFLYKKYIVNFSIAIVIINSNN